MHVLFVESLHQELKAAGGVPPIFHTCFEEGTGVMLNSRTWAFAGLGAILFAQPVFATEDPSVSACKATGLIALQQRATDVTDLIIDQESVAVSAADTKIQDIPVSTVVLGEAYIKKGKETGKPDRFVCLLGEKGKVLLTFFTSK